LFFFEKSVVMIEYSDFKSDANPVFSIIIPSWNNIEFLKTCIDSIRKNSRLVHQIVVHVNEGSDGTKEWLKQEKIPFSYSEENIGVCYAVNAAYSLCKANYILYLNDDMYVCPDWDHYLYQEIKTIGTDYFYLSSTAIEPKSIRNKPTISPYTYGTTVDSFNEKELLKSFQDLPFEDKNGSSWPPAVMHRKLWDLVGGYSPEFSPGLYSDPDISMKLWHAGVRYFKIVEKSRVYHFLSKSVGRAKLNNGRKQFIRKWGISSSTFYKYFLRMGTTFKGELKDPELTFKFKLRLLRDRVKVLFHI